LAFVGAPPLLTRPYISFWLLSRVRATLSLH
jgi:hypothetical protein